MIIPFPPGGTLDFVGRMLAQKLGEQMGQTFVVENRPGGNGTIGADAVAKAPADGYTLLFNASTFTTTPMTMKTSPYDVVKDFQPVALVAKAPLAVAINKNLPVTDVKSLIAHAKANPGKLTFAIGSTGSAGHLSTELLKRASGIEYTDRAVQGLGAGLPGSDRRADRRIHRSDPRLGVLCQERPAEGDRGHVEDARADAARRAHRRRNRARLRVLQLVRPVGPGQAAEGHRAAPERRSQQGAGDRHARQA